MVVAVLIATRVRHGSRVCLGGGGEGRILDFGVFVGSELRLVLLLLAFIDLGDCLDKLGLSV